MRFIRKQVGKGSEKVDGPDSANDPFNEILYRVPGNSMEAPSGVEIMLISHGYIYMFYLLRSTSFTNQSSFDASSNVNRNSAIPTPIESMNDPENQQKLSRYNTYFI
jgi:hypothetical protein